MAKNTRHKRMVGEREQRIKSLKEQIRGHEQLQDLYIAYIACLLDRLGAHDKDNAATLEREEINARIGQQVNAHITEHGKILLYIEKEGEHGKDNGDTCEQG